MGNSLVPKEYIIMGQLICEINKENIVYAEDRTFRIFYFSDDIVKICFKIFTKIKSRPVSRKILYCNELILYIEDLHDDVIETESYWDEDRFPFIEYVSKCLIKNKKGYIIDHKYFYNNKILKN
jgi:hypothetical protein